MVALFSARNDSAHLGKSIFSYNLVPAVRDLIRPGHQNHIIDPALLKRVKCIPDDRLFLQKEKLLLNLAFHPFSLSGCQNDSGGAGRMRCNFLFPKLIQCMFHLVSPPCQNDLLKHSFSTFCQINLLKKPTAKQFFLKKFVLSLAQLQIRHRIQIPACARALLIFIVRRRADHRRIVRTEDR